jgi:hypothetical protein
MRKNFLLIAILVLFVAFAIYAGTTVKDVIKMENPKYAKHTKGIVEFPHKKHSTELKLKCGACHHDDKNTPLDLKEGDNVESCISCHKIPGRLTKEKKAELKTVTDKKVKLSEKLKFHAEAMHKNCTGCHKTHNKKTKTKAAPTVCTKCHPKIAK